MRIHGGNPWVLMRRHGFARHEVLDFSVDVNPLGFPPVVRSAITDHLEDIRCYPDPEAREFRDAVAAEHGIAAEAVLPGNGVAELISLVAQARPGATTVIIVPAFGEYAWAMAQGGATIRSAPTAEAAGFQLHLADHDWAKLLQGAGVVFLCNPNNPTGAAATREAVLELARRCRAAGAWLVVDEAFVEFAEYPNALSVVGDASRLEQVIVLRSLTKLFAIPGLRVGYLVAAPAIVERLRALQPAWPLNTFAAVVGTQVLQQSAYVAQSRRLIATLRDELAQLLGAVPGVRVFPSATNFLLCKLLDPAVASSELCDRLAAQGVLLRSCDSFTGLEPGRFIRVAVRTREDHRRLVGALQQVLAHAG